LRRCKPRGSGHERRGEILAAARALFVAEGYETVTTRKLAGRGVVRRIDVNVGRVTVAGRVVAIQSGASTARQAAMRRQFELGA
jgi:hypothetical protein